jgi:hypothetical protein
MKANEYWTKSVRQCFSAEQLEKEGFNLRDLDLSKKGSISIEDLVCFVNLHTGSFLRNRDVIGLFNRFFETMESKGQTLKYEVFTKILTR